MVKKFDDISISARERRRDILRQDNPHYTHHAVIIHVF